MAAIIASPAVAEAKEHLKSTSVTIRHGRGAARVQVNLVGATVTSWSLAGQELLFTSAKAIYAPGKAIRGGIPIVFPQFGPGPLVQHGFARTSLWTHVGTTVDSTSGDATTMFTLGDSPATRAVWDYAFELRMTIILKHDSFSQQLQVTNREAEKSFNFTTLLHTYFRVDDITKVTIGGLTGKKYVDKVDGGAVKDEKSALVKITGEVDRVYREANEPLFLGDGGNADIMIKRTGFKDIVVWNPWIEKARAMADFGDDEYKIMVCVEAGCVNEPVTLAPSGVWTAAQGFSIRILDQEQAAAARAKASSAL